MIDLKTLTNFLNEYLDVNSIEDKWLINGLQVEGNPTVNRIGFAVDACLESFEKARQAQCDLLIVHHGLRELETIKGLNKERVKFLLMNNMSLCCYHLPLDKNSTAGNNVQLAQSLKLQNIRQFSDIGFQGELEFHESIENFGRKIKELLNSKITLLPFGKQEVKKVAIVSGSGASYLKQAIDEEVDVLLTGEAKHSAYHQAKEGKINIIFGGHYATETLGLKALAGVIKEKFDVEVGFIDSPVEF